MIGNLLRPPPGAMLTKRQKTALRKMRREMFLETGVYAPAGIRSRASAFTRPQVLTAFDDANSDHRPPRVRPDEQLVHASPAPFWDPSVSRRMAAERRRSAT